MSFQLLLNCEHFGTFNSTTPVTSPEVYHASRVQAIGAFQPHEQKSTSLAANVAHEPSRSHLTPPTIQYRTDPPLPHPYSFFPSTKQHPEMSTSTKSRKRAAEDYESDDGFIEDAAPSSKPTKKAKNNFTFTPSAGAQKDDEGNEYWEVSSPQHQPCQLLS